MPNYNNHNIASRRRVRGQSCPAGVRFDVNDITKPHTSGVQRKSSLTNLHLEKESNILHHERRQSLPCEVSHSHQTFATREASTHLLNYSNLAGGDVDNSFCCKLVATHKLNSNHSPVDRSNQHKVLNKSPVHELFDFTASLSPLDYTDFPRNSQNLNTLYAGLNEQHCAGNTSPCIKQAKYVNTSILDLFKAADNSLSNLDDSSFLGTFLREVNGLDLVDLDDNFSSLIRDSGIAADQRGLDLDSDVVNRLECHVYGTEVLVEKLAGQVEETKRDIIMSKRKQENEINDLISLNEEMQTIWSEKEDEVREVLERFSAYRDAVEADSKEKDEIYTEELNKRETIIKDLHMTRNFLEDELTRKTEAFRELINEVENFEAMQAQGLVDVNQLVACLLEQFHGQEASVVCQSISLKLESSIATIKEKDYTRYVNCLNVSRQIESREEFRINGNGAESTKEERNMNVIRAELGDEVNMNGARAEPGDDDVKLRKSFSSSLDEGNGFSILSSSDGERNDLTFADNAGSELNNGFNHDQEQFSPEVFTSGSPLGNGEYYESLDEDLMKLVQGLEEFESDGLSNGYIDRKIVVKLMEEQRSKYQFVCKEKDEEIQHWIRKHKQDTNDWQSILEEQEIVEAKNSESLKELQSELDKLRQRNKFLESEVEFAKEQGEDDVCFLKESFEKNLSAQLRRQSRSFLSVEESTRGQLEDLEAKNDELRQSNEDLRREIAEHYTEIKSWISDILLFSEGEYNEECHSITDVLGILQKIIIDNKRTMDELQEELKEHRDIAAGQEPTSLSQEPTSPTDALLSRSWGGHSWNTGELQKELCCHCKQAKWQRVLKGSFDLVEAGLDVRQDEVESYVHRLSVDEAKYRKKRSLADSLELADDQVEHLQRLSRQEFGPLDTLGEDSLEGSGIYSEGDMNDGRRRLESDSVDDDMIDGQSRLKSDYVESDMIDGEDSLEGDSLDSRNGVEMDSIEEDLLVSLNREETDSVEDMFLGRNRLEEKSVDMFDGSTRAESDSVEKDIFDDPDQEKINSVEEDMFGSGIPVERISVQDSMFDSPTRVDGNSVQNDVFANQSRAKTISVEDGMFDRRSKVEKNASGIPEKSSPESLNQSWQGIQISPRVLKQYSIVSDPGFDTIPRDSNDDNSRSGGSGEIMVRSQETICEEGSVDIIEQWWIEQDSEGEEEDQDRVQVVNLYRSLIVDSNTPQHGDFLDGRNHSGGSFGDEIALRDGGGLLNGESGKLEKESGDELLVVGQLSGESNDESGKLNDESVTEIALEESIRDGNNGVIPLDFPLPIPKITVEKDFQPQDQDTKSGNVEENGVDKISDFSSETQNEEYNMNLSDRNDEAALVEGNDLNEIHQPVLLDEILTKGIDEHDSKVSQSWKIIADPQNSIFEFIGNFADETPCTHCSDLFHENLENLKVKLTELISNQRKENADKILEEFQETKTELRESQNEYEKLERLCEDYRNYMVECSGNLRCKNEELRKLKLSDGIMKTEIEWLRQAIGITRNYGEF